MMFTREELEQAIAECENAQPNYPSCEKLATFYTIHDHLYGAEPQVMVSHETIDDYGESELLSKVRGKDAATVWALLDELMDAVQVTNPKLYDAFMRKLTE